MNTNYTLKNFRVFDEQGATFELAPVTILTGCNSSGKSSVTKSMMLLRPLMQQYKREIVTGTFGGFDGTGFASHLLDFTRDIALHNLGNVERVLNWNSKSSQFTIAYTAHSFALGLDMDVNLVFGKPEELKGELTTLKAELQEVRIEHNGRLFYQFLSKGHKRTNGDNDSILKEDYAFVNIAEWKKVLMERLQWLEMGYLFHRIREDSAEEENGFGYATLFHYGDLESVKACYSENFRNYVYNLYCSLNEKLPQQTKRICQQFDFKNLVHSENDLGIDWEKSKYTYEFPHNHVFSLGKLTDELDEVDKEKIVDFAETKFIDEKVVRKELLDDSNYRSWIHDIFEEYTHSQFESFAEFYAHYEGEDLQEEYVIFGTRGGQIRYHGERDGEFLGQGTARKSKGIMPHWLDKQWNEMNGKEKFECMFYCLQGFGGYEDLSDIGGPFISLPNLDILRQYASLVCAEVIVAGEILSDSYFIELNRARQQRLYSFTDTAHFNRILDEYYNMPESISLKSVYAEFSKEGEYHKGDFANKWIRELTPFSAFQIIPAPNGIGYFISMQKALPNGGIVDVNLCDVGYGMTLLLSMLIQIETVICKYRYLNRYEIPTICVEEPESNLHPNLQSRLADIFADAVNSHPVRFILETHSEYLVRKTQVLVAQQNKQTECSLVKNPFKVYYIPRPEDGKPYEMEYLPNGAFSNSFGSGFYDEASLLSFQVLTM